MFQQSGDPNLPTQQTVKKLWEKTAVDKSAWIKAWKPVAVN